ncbi:hypothetical protein GH733_017735, partial [Mirounga leonina]
MELPATLAGVQLPVNQHGNQPRSPQTKAPQPATPHMPLLSTGSTPSLSAPAVSASFSIISSLDENHSCFERGGGAPLHRVTRYPLLLKSIWERSRDSPEKIMIYAIKEKVEKSLRILKEKWLDNFQKCRHLQETTVWPPLRDRDRRFFIPECLKCIFKEHTAENILLPTNRHLLYEEKLTLAETWMLDTGFLCPSRISELQTVIQEGGSCTVLDQPIALDRLVVKVLIHSTC